MWNSFAKLDRIKKAFVYNKIDPDSLSIADLFNLLDNGVRKDIKALIAAIGEKGK